MSASPFPPFNPMELAKVSLFLEVCKMNPSIMNSPDLVFMKDFIRHFGGFVPEFESQAKPEEFKKNEQEMNLNPESEESDLELDMTGVIEPDTDVPQKMGNLTLEPTEEEISEAQSKRSEAVSAYVEKDLEKAVQLYTEAIVLNPQAALLYAKRGQVYLDLKKPNACIRDCNRALELNPDSAAAHKFRGRAYQLLGQWEEAANDLRFACQLDFDEQADEWLREVTPNARKIEEHKRKKERRNLEKKEQELMEKMKRAKEASKAREENIRTSQTESTPAGGTSEMGDFYQFLNDPEVQQAFKDPEVAEAFRDISSNPANMLKYQNNPKMMALINKVASKFAGAGNLGGLGGMGGFPGMMGGMPGFPGAGATPPKPSAPNDDAGLD